jgi:hypothetical protein
MASVIEQIIDKIVDELKISMIDNEEDEDIHPGLIRGGLLQENPLPYRIVVLVHHNDPDETGTNPYWSDIPAHKDDVSGWNMPVAEIGGGGFVSRRFCIDIKIYFVRSKENRGIARAYAARVIENAEMAISTSQCTSWSIVSKSGEIPLQAKIYKTMSSEGGGPPSSHIWSAKILFTVLTEQP